MQYKIVVDKQPRTNPSNEKKEYTVDIEELRISGDVYDSLIFTRDETYVLRRLELTEYHVLNPLTTPIKQSLTEIDIQLFEGDNYIYLVDVEGNKLYAEYLVKNEFTGLYVSQVEMNSAITQTVNEINLAVNTKLQDYSTTTEMNSAINQKADEINIEVNKKVNDTDLTGANITLRINNDQSQATINADKININGAISANGNFEIDSQGNMSCSNAEVGGKITAEEGTIGGFDIRAHKIISDTDTTSVEVRDGTTDSNGYFLLAWKKVNGVWSIPFSVTADGYLYASNVNIQGNISGSQITGSQIRLDAGTAVNPNFKIGTYSWIRDGQMHMGENTSNGSFVDILGGVIDGHVTDPGVYVSRGGYNTSINYWGISTGQVDCGNLYVSGSKNRVVEIENGEKVLLNAYETATPYFGDIGSDKTNDNGICRIDIEDIFSQTIELENYKVFIQKCGEGDLYVKKYDRYFEVIGTPNLEFDWEIKAIQKGFSTTRLKKFERKVEQENAKN